MNSNKHHFTKDGWNFQVTIQEYNNRWGYKDGRHVIVKFYDDTLSGVWLDDIEGVYTFEPSTKTVTEDTKILGVIPWSTEKEIERELPPLEEQIDRTMGMAWEKIEDIDESPSEVVDNALEKHK